ncbi:circularly permuted type 2 ATP-grasp protein [Paracoccus sp. MBLB3053]|uniref:Circularly permuted type 2 ATP-grasp protein n=1 Tax=Paracoccus aurantius TaxID=3073814 RepID=A0ABU2HS16_9RHOB|nr:circularly permuted type 2 ATP-grasp protein [Paracoccus sp. MBLB3053]MDS9467845.1 circularly permuted type 2 ATP-grasp protein [Paracoccus sp. MBLB3053]
METASGSDSKSAAQPRRGGLGIADYAPLPGVPDEMVDALGKIRPLWKPLLDHIERLPPDLLARSLARANQYLRDSGVFYRQYGGGNSTARPWPLSHIPVLISERDWEEVSAALIQRAELLEAVMADLYGPNQLVAAGHLPPSLVASNPQWLRPMVGIKPRTGRYLNFIAFEIGRGPQGLWWVLSDRTQAPSGAGYALENRVATSRAFADLFAVQNVHRLAGFFRDFRDHLLQVRADNDALIAILTPGPLNETYFEQAWIARYLGFMLVQGDDLVVENGHLMVRTVSGLRPVDLLWRRMDGEYTDPLELNPASRIGTPGLVSALRKGGLSMLNSLGSGVLEARAMMAFLPKLSGLMTGKPLAMPNIATWWLGGSAERDEVLANPRNIALSPALGTGLPFDSETAPVLASGLTSDELRQRLAQEGPELVAQETVGLSTTPALIDGRIVPRPFSLRVFLARTAEGWEVMPGGFARIGNSEEATALAMQRGGAAADVWIVSNNEVPAVTMVPTQKGPYRRSAPSTLPSRAADNLFWMGRYVERTEQMVRILRARHIREAESGRGAEPIQHALDRLLKTYGIKGGAPIPSELIDTLSAASSSAGQVRDRFSTDGWSALSDLEKTARQMAGRVSSGDDAARALSAILRKLAGFSGLVHENMYRFYGWRFLALGRLLERALGTAGMVAALAEPDAPQGALDLCVELGDSVMTHRQRYAVSTSRETVIDLLVLDPMNPRSVRNQIDEMMVQMAELPGSVTHGEYSLLARAILRCQTKVATETPETLSRTALLDLATQIAAISDNLTEAYLR